MIHWLISYFEVSTCYHYHCTCIHIIPISWRSVWRTILVALECQQRVQPLQHQHCEAIHFSPGFTKRNPFNQKMMRWRKSNGEDWFRTVHECCCGRRRAKLQNESWHQLFSIPTVVSLVSFHLLTILSKFYPMLCKGLHAINVIIYWISAGTCVLTFNNFMIFQGVLLVGFTLGRLLRLSCFRRKMRAVRRNWGTIIYIYNMLVANQRPSRRLQIMLKTSDWWIKLKGAFTIWIIKS